jgi:hypothetical protein
MDPGREELDARVPSLEIDPKEPAIPIFLSMLHGLLIYFSDSNKIGVTETFS